VSRRDQVAIVLFALGAVVAGAAVVALASQLCPGPTANDPCPDAERNRLLVVGVVGTGVVLLLTPVLMVLDYAMHRRIAYHGAWWRALRRGLLIGLAVAAVAALRSFDALNVFSATVVIGIAVALEWIAIRRLDGA
jgi:hypothetical protein